jgi:hypothetical protein
VLKDGLLLDQLAIREEAMQERIRLLRNATSNWENGWKNAGDLPDVDVVAF